MGFSSATFATLQLGASIFEAIGASREGEIKAEAQEFAAGSDIFNASIARQEARLAQVRAKLEISRKRKAQEALISEQQVLFAISGVRIDEGTPLVVMQDTLETTELDILITQFNADVESQFLESEARQLELRASQRRLAATQERTAGRLRAGKTLLSSLSTFAQKFPGEDTIIGGGTDIDISPRSGTVTRITR